MTQPSLARALVAEAVGTFALVFAGCGAIMVDAKTEALGQVGIALSFGLVIMVMIYALGHVSGAHLNPAVTFSFALTRHFPPRRIVPYCAAQLAGALLAAAVLRGSLGDIARIGATYPSGSDGQAFLWEVVLSFFLVLVIMAVATDARAVGEAAAIAIGGTVGLERAVRRPDQRRVDEPGSVARAGDRRRRSATASGSTSSPRSPAPVSPPSHTPSSARSRAPFDRTRVW